MSIAASDLSSYLSWKERDSQWILSIFAYPESLRSLAILTSVSSAALLSSRGETDDGVELSDLQMVSLRKELQSSCTARKRFENINTRSSLLGQEESTLHRQLQVLGSFSPRCLPSEGLAY